MNKKEEELFYLLTRISQQEKVIADSEEEIGKLQWKINTCNAVINEANHTIEEIRVALDKTMQRNYEEH